MVRQLACYTRPVTSEAKTQVPAGHEVRLLRGSVDPSIARMPGGLLVASTGLGGDDQVSEVSALIEALATEIKPYTVTMNAAIAQLVELFAPNAPTTRERESATLVYLQNRSLVGWTDAALDSLASTLRELGRRTTLFVFLDPSHDVLRIAPVLAGAGLELRTPAPDGTIVAEVRRPDGSIVTALIGNTGTGGVSHDAAASDEAAAPLARSPRLDTLVLSFLQVPTEESKRALDDYLAARTAPLALIASKGRTGEFGIQPRSWPDKQGLVAYGDERSLHRSARELDMPVGSYAIAAMPVPKLFTWAVSLQLPVMICAFDDSPNGTHSAWHVALEVDDLRRLGS